MGEKPERPGERMLAVLSMQALTHRQARVAAAIAYRDGAGGASPSMKRIAEEAGLSHRARAAETIAELERLGVLTRHRTKTTNVYRLAYDWTGAPQCPRKPDSETPRHSVRVSPSTVSAIPGREPEEPEQNLQARAGAGLTGNESKTRTMPACTVEPPTETESDTVRAREGAPKNRPLKIALARLEQARNHKAAVP